MNAKNILVHSSFVAESKTLNIIEWVSLQVLIWIYRLILLNAKSRTEEIVDTLILIIRIFS
jgi:hypothetical protein